MSCTEKELFEAMDSKRMARVTCTDGQVFTGQCWAYGAIVAEEEYGVKEPCLDVGSTMLRASEIEKIEFVD